MPGSEVNEAHTKIGPVIALADRASGHGGFQVLVTGDATLSRDFTQLSESDLQKGEAIGIPIALLILLAVFGARRRGARPGRAGAVLDRRRARPGGARSARSRRSASSS